MPPDLTTDTASFTVYFSNYAPTYDTTYTTSANSNFIYFDSFCAQSIDPQVTHKYGKNLTEAEKDYIRKINCQPTQDGVEKAALFLCSKTQLLKTLPVMRARFDRRIPCWRSTRWKSLT